MKERLCPLDGQFPSPDHFSSHLIQIITDYGGSTFRRNVGTIFYIESEPIVASLEQHLPFRPACTLHRAFGRSVLDGRNCMLQASGVIFVCLCVCTGRATCDNMARAFCVLDT